MKAQLHCCSPGSRPSLHCRSATCFRGIASFGRMAAITEEFEAFKMSFFAEAAKATGIQVCAQFTAKGYQCKGLHCEKLHIDKKGELRPSKGAVMAHRLHLDPAMTAPSHGCPISPLLAFQAWLIVNNSKLVIDKVEQEQGCYVFKFSMTGQTVPLHVWQIYRQRFVWVDLGPDEEPRCLHASDLQAPKKYMHAVKTASLQASMNILLEGFDYGEHSCPFGVYSVVYRISSIYCISCNGVALWSICRIQGQKNR